MPTPASSGSAWHESNEAALAFAGKRGRSYFHPFADPEVVAGQGTVGLEILEQMPDVDTVLVAMGGGGLISGVATAIKALAPDVRIVGIEAAGSPVLLRAIEAGANVALDRVTTSVATMACARTDERIFEIVRDKVDEIVLVDDDEMRDAAAGSGSRWASPPTSAARRRSRRSGAVGTRPAPASGSARSFAARALTRSSEREVGGLVFRRGGCQRASRTPANIACFTARRAPRHPEVPRQDLRPPGR